MIGAYLAFVGHFVFKRAFLNIPVSLINNDIGTKYLIRAADVLKWSVYLAIIPLNLALLTYFYKSKYHAPQAEIDNWIAHMEKAKCTAADL